MVLDRWLGGQLLSNTASSIPQMIVAREAVVERFGQSEHQALQIPPLLPLLPSVECHVFASLCGGVARWP